jgi:hypothetical protein
MLRIFSLALAFIWGLTFIICGLIMIAIQFEYWFPHAFIVIGAGVMLIDLSITK